MARINLDEQPELVIRITFQEALALRSLLGEVSVTDIPSFAEDAFRLLTGKVPDVVDFGASLWKTLDLYLGDS